MNAIKVYVVEHHSLESGIDGYELAGSLGEAERILEDIINDGSQWYRPNGREASNGLDRVEIVEKEINI
jgi:hypothetical protein